MEIQISVRNLVEFILREGDIDNRHATFSENAMLEGGKIHRMIQKKMGIEYEAEVPLRYVRNLEGYSIIVDGRADGVIHEKNRVCIDEIKGTYKDLKRLKEANPVHLAQAKCYAYIVALEEELPQIEVQMTYCNMDTLEIKYFKEEYFFEELEEWFQKVLDEYQKWSDFEYEWKMKRQESIHKVQFPYEYRMGQKELAGYVYQTICHEKKLFIEAPTGVGKTITTLFPAIKAMGEEKADKIFYLTAKTITRKPPMDAINLLREKGLNIKSVALTAKEKICMAETMDCNPENCPYAKGHFSRINDAMYDLLTTRDEFDRQTIEEYANKHMVCPFEMSLDMSLFSDAIICDYNYLFDPYVYLKRFFAEGVKRPYLFLVDEAHNLVERGRQMYSATLYKEDFLALKHTISEYHTGLEKFLDRCNKCLLELKKETEDLRVLDSAGSFDLALTRLHGAMSSFLEDHDNSPVRQDILDFYFEVSRYLQVNEQIDENYVTYVRYQEDGRFLIKQLCVDPSERLKEQMEMGKATILFSATLLPIQYYKQLLGGMAEDFEVYASSSFSPSQMKLLVGMDVTSKYTRRTESEFQKIAAYIDKITRAKSGNYMVFCPSYSMLESIYESYVGSFYREDQEIVCQQEYMDESQRELFLSIFSENTDSGSILGFCVLGGIFSEGIDLKGEALIGSIIVGTGLAQINPEQELLRSFFDETGRDGFDYAYRFPGMNKVLQAGGRVIRTMEDRGVVALLDERFLQRAYQNLFPREWKTFHRVTLSQIDSLLDEFWSNES